MASNSPEYINQLRNLNDRLAALIDRVRSEGNNENRLESLIIIEKENAERALMKLKDDYERQLARNCTLLTETAKENAKYQFDIQKLSTEVEELTKKYYKAEKDVAETHEKLEELKTKNNELSANLDQLKQDMEDYIYEKKIIAGERETLNNKISELQQKLESEIVDRSALQKRIQVLNLDLEFKQNQFNEEIERSRAKETEINEMKDQLQEKHNTQLQGSLHELREIYEIQIKKIREDLTTDYGQKIRDLEELAEKQSKKADTHLEDLHQARAQLDGVKTTLAELSTYNNNLKCRVSELEESMEQERTAHARAMAASQGEIMRLREDKAKQLLENLALKDDHNNLQVELMNYRKLLEFEESRLQLTPEQTSLASQDALLATPPRQKPAHTLETPMKRKRTISEESYYSIVDDYATKSVAKSYVELVDVDSNGKYVRLQNKSEKEVSLGRWKLVHKANEIETTYKFHRSFKAPPGAIVTVWSAGCTASPEPPVTLVMKEQRWYVASEMVTQLLNDSEELMAQMEKTGVPSNTTFVPQERYEAVTQVDLKAAQPSTSFNYQRRFNKGASNHAGIVDNIPQKGNPEKDNACLVM